VVVHSLFEEQIVKAAAGSIPHLDRPMPVATGGSAHFPSPGDVPRGPAEYLDHVRRIKESVSVPVIGSLNGVGANGWLEYGPLIEQAGADALELNLYYLSTGTEDASQDIERHIVEIVQTLHQTMHIPVTVKLSPFYTAMANVTSRLAAAGASGLILFNHFYQTDLDIEALTTVSNLRLSTSAELLLRLRWLAILSGRVPTSFAASGGVHTPVDGVKALLSGANAVQMVSAILQHGPEHFRVMEQGLRSWMARHHFETVDAYCGRLNLRQYANPSEFERSNYLKLLQTWSG
jgi:dihydroorotate dehydrogenase (fumarate)